MAVTRFVFFILLSLRYPRREEIPQLKAKAGMPVIQELMGGWLPHVRLSVGGCEGYLDLRRWNRRSQRRRRPDSVDKRSDRRHADLQVSLESPAGAKRDAVLRSRYCQMGVCIRRAVSRNLAASRRSDFATTTNRCALSVWRTHDADGTSPSLTSTQCRRHPGNRGARHLSWQERTDRGHHRNRASRRALKIPSTANAERNGRNRQQR